MSEPQPAIGNRCWRCALPVVIEACGSGYVIVQCKRCKSKNVVHLVVAQVLTVSG